MIKVGINRSLWLFGVVQLISILGFAALSSDSHVQPIVDQRPIRDLSILPPDAAPYLLDSTRRSEEDILLRPVDLNTASLETLAALPPIAEAEDPEALAQSIIDARPLRTGADHPLFTEDLDWHVTVQTNVNTASKSELTAHALLSETDVEAIVSARSEGLLTDLSGLSLPDDFAPLAAFRIDPNTATPSELALLPGLMAAVRRRR